MARRSRPHTSRWAGQPGLCRGETLRRGQQQLLQLPPDSAGGKGEADIDKLSAIIKVFNDLFGNIEWKDEDKIRKVIAEEIPARVARDKAYQNAQANSDKQNAKLEHDLVLKRVVGELLFDHTELFKQFNENSDFKHWLTDTVFDATYRPKANPSSLPPST